MHDDGNCVLLAVLKVFKGLKIRVSADHLVDLLVSINHLVMNVIAVDESALLFLFYIFKFHYLLRQHAP